MGALSKILRNGAGGRLTWWCPGCNAAHQVVVDGPHAWGWNGDAERPTFTPSVLVEYEHWVPPATRENPNPGPQTKVKDVCHSFVVDGQMQFLGDCTHALAGQTVPIPEWPAIKWQGGE